MNWLRLFVSPYGVIGQRTFLHGVIVIVFVNTAVTVGAVALHGPAGWPLLATCHPTVCVTAKRLHTLNRSAWLQAPQRLLVAAALATPLVPKPWWTAHAPLEWLIWGMGLLAAATDAILYLYLALHRADPTDRIGEIFG